MFGKYLGFCAGLGCNPVCFVTSVIIVEILMMITMTAITEDHKSTMRSLQLGFY